jgi:ferredoxin-type protein NapH
LASREQPLRRQKKTRKLVQTAALLLGNAWLPGFWRGTIYQGPLKAVCLPGLNCYSCPGAIGACPLGSLQGTLADPLQIVSLYLIGFLTILGGLFGRFVCGWLCPFGLTQEALHHLPLRKWKPNSRHIWDRRLSYGKYVTLAVFAIALPFFGMLWNGYGEPAFCEYICPSGTLMAGIPLLLANEQLRLLIGWLFSLKAAILLVVIVASGVIFRPFCRYLCPLGAIYGFFNRISLYRVVVDESRCNQCGACTQHCPMAVPVPEDGNTASCIRCGECAAVCPQQAIRVGFARRISSSDPQKTTGQDA